MTLFQMEVLVAVSNAGNFTPPISRQIGLAVRSLREAPPAVQAFLREAERIAPTL
ncbi:hypothetical protein [Brevibacillus antibioticus]|uniref:hypothetical protein n=1 Tax=Brevibacillus antibioticus TaxID=2570228 RepID=UPI001FCA7957|nr:hypothetical protein [Brevibacillus antibioticus]